MAALTAASRENVTQGQQRQDRLAAAWQDLEQIVADAATELNGLLTFYVHSQDSGYRAAELLDRPPFTPHYAQSAGWLLFPVGHQRPAVEVVVTAALRTLREDDPADIAALIRVDRIIGQGNVHEPHVIWKGKYPGIPVASARQANVVADIRAGLTGSFAETMRRVIEILAASGAARG